MRIKQLGLSLYDDIYSQMQEFTGNRQIDTEDEVWFCEHFPVFTLGWQGAAHHILDAHNIPVIKCDRGGQVTYHGPGQLMIYFLIDLKRSKQAVASFVSTLETTVLQILQYFDIQGQCRPDMPGVYVAGQKIASVGLRIKNGRTYHGVALNINMDLTPFTYIHPCGYADLKMTQMCDWVSCTVQEVNRYARFLISRF